MHDTDAEYRLQEKFRDGAARKAKLEADLAAVRSEMRADRTRLKNISHSETWHLCALGRSPYIAGFSGDMAAAWTTFLRMPLEEAREVLERHRSDPSATSLLALAHRYCTDHQQTLTHRGNAILLADARQRYAVECAEWQAAPDTHRRRGDWRRKKATRTQQFLILRMVEALDLVFPGQLDRGAAHDFIEAHGGNPRLAEAALSQRALAMAEALDRHRPSLLDEETGAA